MALANEAHSVQGQEQPSAQAEISPLFSLRARLSLIMILALVPAGIFLIFDVLTIRREVHTQAQADLRRLSEVAAKSYGQQLDEARRLMAAIALFPEVHGDSVAGCEARLGEMVALNQPKYQGFAVVNLDGTVLCSSPQITATVQLADRLWFREAVRTRQFAIGEFTIGRPIGVPVLGLGYPVLDEGGAAIRVVAHGMSLRQFQDRMDDLPLPPDAVMTITDRDGIILARVPGGEQWVGKRQTDVNLQELYKQSQGEVEAQGVDGVTRLYAFTPIVGPSSTDVWLSIGPGVQPHGRYAAAPAHGAAAGPGCPTRTRAAPEPGTPGSAYGRLDVGYHRESCLYDGQSARYLRRECGRIRRTRL
jgi:hypothetical protein